MIVRVIEFALMAGGVAWWFCAIGLAVLWVVDRRAIREAREAAQEEAAKAGVTP